MISDVKTGVYCWRNWVNGKVYVGGAYTSLRRRIQSYVRDLPRGRCHNLHFLRAWKKYGAENFTCEILELVDGGRTAIKKREQFWIDFYKAANPRHGYNICPRAESSLGAKRSKKTRERISKAKAGKKRTAEACASMSAAMKRRWEDEEYRRKITEAAKDNWRNASYRSKVLSAIAAPECKKRRSEVQKGQKHSRESMEKAWAASRGRKHSEETKAAMSAAKKKRWDSLTEEERKKIRENMSAGCKKSTTRAQHIKNLADRRRGTKRTANGYEKIEQSVAM